MSGGTRDKFPVIIANVRYNVYVTYPSGAVEVYTYKLNGNTMFVGTVTYSDSTKEEIESVEWT
jgi:hypothetical protein